MIALNLSPEDQARLGKLAAERGETIEETARGILLDHIYAAEWGEDSDEDWALSCESMAAEVLPDEDWSDIAPQITEGEPNQPRPERTDL